MAIEVKINNVSIQYPQIGDTEWGNNATNFAIQTATAFDAIGLSGGTTVDLPGTLDVTGNTTLDANLTVGGTTSLTGNVTLTNNLTVNGNTQLGNANSDTIGVTGIVNVDSGTLYVDPANNRVGINKTTPAQALDVVGDVAVSGNETVGGTLGVTGDVAINTNKFNITASSGNTLIAGTLGVTSDITTSGILTASNSTNVTTAPPITFTGDTNTGIGRSGADTLDFITNGNSRFRIESTGQIKAVYESQVGTDYNTQLDNGYFCRAWVNFDGTLSGTITPRASGNVSSITDNGTGNYTVNFTTAMPDANYSVVGIGNGSSGNFNIIAIRSYNQNGVSLYTGSGHIPGTSSGTPFDEGNVLIAVFR
jgi:hypothetical protein